MQHIKYSDWNFFSSNKDVLALGVKNIKLGPSLPAFVSPDMLKILVGKFGIVPISTPENDLKAIKCGCKF